MAEQPKSEAEMRAMQERILRRHTQLDMDPLDNSRQKPWWRPDSTLALTLTLPTLTSCSLCPSPSTRWLLYPGDTAEVHFRGTRLGILTMIGPDAGTISCEIDGGQFCRTKLLLDRWARSQRRPRISLPSRPRPCPYARSPALTSCSRAASWAYFWRLAVVSLIDDLPPGPHVARLRLEAETPDRAILKRTPSGPHWAQCQREGKAHKLWLMHWLIEEESELERALAHNLTAKNLLSTRADAAARRGGVSEACGGRRAHAHG